MSTGDNHTIDITPTPRVLQMLGEVDLSPRRCFAEFIDNALDEGVDGTPGRASGDSGGEPLRIEIETPTIREFDDDYENAEVTIWDNGPGMSPEDLEDNLKAGYSGKDPLGSMGLFGVGFNIATARLGSRTTVKTTRAGDEYWAVATIDLRKLAATDSYDVDVTFEEKMDPAEHGTKITITRLEEFARTLRRKQNLKSGLGRMYTAVLQNNNVEIFFNGDEIQPRPHCIWSEERSANVGGEEYPAYINIDEKVGEGHYCKECWAWWEQRLLGERKTGNGSTEYVCPSCEDGGEIVHREQRVWGWVGIQRYLDPDHYGIDLIRNGRVIEELDKSLFKWENPETGEMEEEYPLDNTYWGGRIVGELHIDFVPVTNIKDAFRKGNDRWKKVREAIRGGEVSFRPTYANEYGHEPNRSPLGKLFKGFRQAKEAGKKRLVPGEVQDDGSVKPINAKPKEWAEKFREGVQEYQDDTKWWEAVERAEIAKRSSGNPFADDPDEDQDDTGDSSNESDDPEFDISPGGDSGPSDSGSGTGDTDRESGDGNKSEDQNSSEEDEDRRGLESTQDDELSGQYGLEEIGEQDIEVEAYRLVNGELGGEPVVVEAPGWANRTITYDPDHGLYTNFGHEPINSVLMEVASTLLTRMDDPEGWTQSRIYAALMDKYCQDDSFSVSDLAKQATGLLNRIKEMISRQKFNLDGHSVPSDVEEEATRGYLSDDDSPGELESLFETTAYLQYAPDKELVRYLHTNPEQFFDGNVWEQEYNNLPSENLKQEVVDEFVGYVRDIQMLANEGLGIEVTGAGGDNEIQIERAAASLRLLDAKTPVNS